MVDDSECEKRKEWDNCYNCLFDWYYHGDGPCGEDYSNYCDAGFTLYSYFHELRNTNEDWKECVKVSRKIANMPVREDV